MELDIEENKNKFIELVKTNIHREGVNALLEYLQKTDFFIAPASTKFHSNCKGGLCAHSINVFNRLVLLLEKEYGETWQEKYSLESATIIGLFHDLCKIDTYTVEMRNVKENGAWVQKPFYATNDKMPYGHGEKSVYIINGFLHLSREEAMSINWHMGGYDMRVKAGFNLSEVYYAYPIAFLTNIADNMATYLDEEIGE